METVNQVAVLGGKVMLGTDLNRNLVRRGLEHYLERI
jgi:hypothetical protein